MFKDIIQQITAEFTTEIEKYFSQERIITIAEIEEKLPEKVAQYVTGVASQYAEAVDQAILEDKATRRSLGYSVQRHRDERTILTSIGEVSYKRTYYRGREGYVYLADEALGIGSGERVSKGVKGALTEAAREMSYAASSRYVCQGRVSRQSVMGSVRAAYIEHRQPREEKKKVANLHIDADEAHITLRGGRKSQVPLISVYEGIDRSDPKRHVCRNIFHISEYGITPDELWEQTLTAIERQYDLEATTIYVHGDGASWINRHREWIPSTRFVLDKYHKNQAITAMLAGLSDDLQKRYREPLHLILSQGDTVSLEALAKKLIELQPDREEKILAAEHYLSKHIEAIAICFSDSEANNGGCTEPHVSNRLSRRLSNRPMAWSRQTLKHLAPLLASDAAATFIPNIDKEDDQLSPPGRDFVEKRAASASTKPRLGFSSLPTVSSLPILRLDHSSPLQKTLRSISAFSSDRFPNI